MKIIECLRDILDTLRSSFTQKRVFQLFKSHVISNIQLPGRHTISNAIVFQGKEQEDWSKDYRLFSTSQWDVEGCMDGVLKEGLQWVPQELSFVPFAIDLTNVRKHGKHIPGTAYQVDPLSPPFQRGLMWAQRLLHTSLLIPQHQHNLPSRSVPVRLQSCPFVKKPGKKASLEEIAAYKELRKVNNSSIHSVEMLRGLRDSCTALGETRKLLCVGDGGFCNRNLFRGCPAGIDLLVRCRKDAKLCFRHEGKGSFYSPKKFTPEEVRLDESIEEKKVGIFYGGDLREIRYKEAKNVYWQHGAKKLTLRLLVIKPVPYRRTSSGYTNYRDPAYILTTDLESKAMDLLQAYFNRIEIEQNHRDMKNNLGLGEGQVRSPQSVEKHPQVIMLAYSLLLLATIKAFGPKRNEAYMAPPKWYKGRKRPSIEDMKRQVRRELDETPECREYFGIRVPWNEASQRCVI